MPAFYVQAYDVAGSIVARADCSDEHKTHRAFLELCCGEDCIIDRVEAFISGDPKPVVYGYRNCRSMRNLIMDIAIRDTIN